MAQQRVLAAAVLGPRHPEAFDQASAHVTPDDVRDAVLVSSDLGAARRLARRATPTSASTSIYLHHVGRSSDGFLDAFGEHVLPQLATAPEPRRWRVRITDTGDLWWKNAVVYCLDVETYMDWNGDGIGDFAAWPSGSTTSPTSASPACG